MPGRNSVEKTYSKKSSVPSFGKGLFAQVDINKGSIIVEFRGKLRRPHDKVSSSRSNIYFNDGHKLECPPTDLASFANDAINFTGNRRKLMECLKSSTPFYEKHPNTKINAAIKLNDNLHRAFLIAEEDIKIGDEIFCHYGFMYWFRTELTTVGFLEEEEIEKHGFPEKIFEYPAFLSYVKEFYPGYVKHSVMTYDDTYIFVVHLKNGFKVSMPMENFSRIISRVSGADAEEVLAKNRLARC
jgi:hypothetical protein